MNPICFDPPTDDPLGLHARLRKAILQSNRGTDTVHIEILEFSTQTVENAVSKILKNKGFGVNHYRCPDHSDRETMYIYPVTDDYWGPNWGIYVTTPLSEFGWRTVESSDYDYLRATPEG